MNRESIIEILMEHKVPFEVAEDIVIELENEIEEEISNIYTDFHDTENEIH